MRKPLIEQIWTVTPMGTETTDYSHIDSDAEPGQLSYITIYNTDSGGKGLDVFLAQAPAMARTLLACREMLESVRDCIVSVPDMAEDAGVQIDAIDRVLTAAGILPLPVAPEPAVEPAFVACKKDLNCDLRDGHTGHCDDILF